MKKLVALVLCALMLCSCLTCLLSAQGAATDNASAPARQGSTMVPLSDCDTLDGWSGGDAAISNTVYSQGTGSVTRTLQGIENSNATSVAGFCYASPLALDIRHMDLLVFDYYISSVEAIPDGWSGQITLRDENGDEQNEMRYTVSLSELEAGWNRFEIPLAEFEVVGEVDQTHICYFEICDDPSFAPKGIAGKITLFAIDNLYFVKKYINGATFYSTGKPASGFQWCTGGVTKLMNDDLYGSNVMTSTLSSTGGFRWWLINSALDVSSLVKTDAKSELKLVFDFYVSDVTAVANTSFNVYLSNATGDDVNASTNIGAYCKSLSQLHTGLKLKNGWNTIEIPFSNLVAGGKGMLDVSNIRTFLFTRCSEGNPVVVGETPVILKLANVRVARIVELEEQEDTGILYYDGSAPKTSYSTAGNVIETDGDYGSVMSYTLPAKGKFCFWIENGMVDITGMTTLTFDLYVSDAAAAAAGYWALYLANASGNVNGAGNLNAYDKFLTQLTADGHLVDGWNHIRIPLDRFAQREGWNPAAVKAFNLTSQHELAAGLTFKIDNIKFEKEVPVATEVLLHNGGWSNGYSTSKTIETDGEHGNVLTHTQAAAGTFQWWLHTKTINATSLIAPADVTEWKNNAALAFDFYVSDADAITAATTLGVAVSVNGGSNFNGDGNFNKENMNFLSTVLGDFWLQDGWNTVYVPFSLLGKGGNTDWNPTEIKSVWLQLQNAGAATYKLDNVRLMLASDIPEAPARPAPTSLTFYTMGQPTALWRSTLDGEGYMHHTLEATAGVTFWFRNPTLDVTSLVETDAMSELKVVFDLYVSDITSIANAGIEFRIGNDTKGSINENTNISSWGKKLSQLHTGAALKDGWNTIEVPLSAFAAGGTGLLDFSKINSFLFAFNAELGKVQVGETPVTLKLANVKFEKIVEEVAPEIPVEPELPEEPEFVDNSAAAIKGAQLNLQENLNMLYYVDVTGYAAPVMIFKSAIANKMVTGTAVTAEGYNYTFWFEGILAHRMSETITAEVYTLDAEGKLLKATKAYSAKECLAAGLKNATDDKLKALISATLRYGAATQIAMNYMVDDLATDGVEGLVDVENVAPVAVENLLVAGSEPVATWYSAALALRGTIELRLSFKAKSLEGLEIHVGDTVYTEFKDGGWDKVGNKLYCIDIPVMPYDYETPIVAVFNGDAEANGTVTYSVDTYLARNLDKATFETLDLLIAINNYGTAADAYTGK